MEQQYTKFIEFAPILIVVLMFLWQHKVFVTPDQLEKKHREIVDDIEEKYKNKYVEINAYKEFQNRVYSELEKVSSGIEELKEFLIRGK